MKSMMFVIAFTCMKKLCARMSSNLEIQMRAFVLRTSRSVELRSVLPHISLAILLRLQIKSVKKSIANGRHIMVASKKLHVDVSKACITEECVYPTEGSS